jgi:hypothetical protein
VFSECILDRLLSSVASYDGASTGPGRKPGAFSYTLTRLSLSGGASNECRALPAVTDPRSPVVSSRASGPTGHTAAAAEHGLTLVHVKAELEQLQDTFMSEVGLYGGQKRSS